MKISIMRHGRPDVPDFDKWIMSREFLTCLEVYDQCPLLMEDLPSQKQVDKLNENAVVVTSDLRRSIETAKYIFGSREVLVDSLFREAEHTAFNIPIIRLHPKVWAYMFLILWLLGILQRVGGMEVVTTRAQDCANRLIDLAKKHDSVLLVGHGVINTYIVKELRRQGWMGPRKPSYRHWGWVSYLRQAKG